MANEILVLNGTARREYGLVFLFPIAAPATYGPPSDPTANTFIPTPSADLAEQNELALAALEPAEITALDNGTLAYEYSVFRKPEDISGPQLVQHVQQIYQRSLAEFNARYALETQHLGTRLNG